MNWVVVALGVPSELGSSFATNRFGTVLALYSVDTGSRKRGRICFIGQMAYGCVILRIGRDVVMVATTLFYFGSLATWSRFIEYTTTCKLVKFGGCVASSSSGA